MGDRNGLEEVLEETDLAEPGVVDSPVWQRSFRERRQTDRTSIGTAIRRKERGDYDVLRSAVEFRSVECLKATLDDCEIFFERLKNIRFRFGVGGVKSRFNAEKRDLVASAAAGVQGIESFSQ